MPRSPLPPSDGLSARWVRTPDNRPGDTAPWASIRDFLRDRLPARVDVDARLARGDFVDEAGRPLAPDAPYRANRVLWFTGPPPTDAPPSEPLRVLYRDERVVVIDKPHGQATTPRGVHARNTALAQVRVELDLPEASPAHRLDRLTAGVLLFTTQRRWRRPYQELFAGRGAAKGYEALAPTLASVPERVESHIIKQRGSLQAVEVPDAPVNAVTLIARVETRGDLARYALRPLTGRTHQLRVHLNRLGAPILNDPLYPVVRDADAQPAEPLALLARSLSFVDPVDHTPRHYASTRALVWPGA